MTIPAWATSIKSFHQSVMRGNELVLKRCIYCGNIRWNFQINIDTGKCGCWVCGQPAPGFVTKFLKDANIEFDYADIVFRREQPTEAPAKIVLPDNRKLAYMDSNFAKRAKEKLYSRGMTDELIEEWDVRLATGDDSKFYGFDYLGYMFFPFYGVNGLEYYIAVGFEDRTLAYKFPHSTHADKKAFYPVQRGSSELILVEGLFDGMSVYKFTKLDILILMGKFISWFQELMLKQCGYEKIYICLDGEALKEGGKLGNRLYRAGLPVYLVKLPWKKDPDDVGENIQKYLDEAVEFTDTTMNRVRLEALRMAQ